ncbi:MAG: DUF3606 domain-containing protein [Sphingobium sp.]|uniref:DUF3606 domain-containing protein n=1 Tax=Sphingobium sp. TaxID=1912891 RepID=UPI001A232D63|nr:DUF3606 domain-containing protein [Sphingobium sp.]MBJ7444134.1 DUF3606 domain-containing protein [Sphingobium sp.]
MNQDQSRAGPPEASHVCLDDADAIDYWTRRFDVSREELEEAVDTVGDSVDAVAAYLNTAS